MGELGIGLVASCAAAVCGAGGIACVVVTTPRSGASVVAMFVAFTTMLVGGILGIEGTPVASPAWGGRLISVGALALFAAALLLLRDARRRDRALEIAAGESEAQQAAAQRSAAANVRLEDELREARSRLAAAEKHEKHEKHVAASDDSARAPKDAAPVRHRTVSDASSAVERKYRWVFEGAIEGMATLERETLRLGEVNASLVRMTGFSSEELGERTILELFAEGPQRPTKTDLQRAGRERLALTAPIARKDGGTAHGELTVTVIGSGSDTRLLAVVRDVTDRQLVEQEAVKEVLACKERERVLVEANREMEARASEMAAANARLAEQAAKKDHLVSTVSHELRTPLTSIGSFSEILLNHPDVERAVRDEFLGIIQKESARLTRLVNGVLDLARIEAGETRLEAADFDGRDVVRDAIDSVAGMSAQRSVTVRARVGTRPRALFGDRDRVQQLLVNLLANAVKFSPEGGEVRIEVKDGPAPGDVEFSVTDQGPGIAPDELERVFEKFRRSEDAPARGVDGTGLGLAICREIATLHGGTVGVESAPGRGSRFWTILPGADEGRRLDASRPRAHTRAADVAPPGVVPVVLPVSAPEPRPAPAPAPRTAPKPPPAARNPRSAGAAWSTTGSLPPLRAAARRETGAATGELPPIR